MGSPAWLALDNALAQFKSKAPKATPRGTAYQLPVVRVEMPYRKRRSKKTPAAIVDFKGRAVTAAEAGRLLLEEHGFVVLPGEEVNFFLSKYLLMEPPRPRPKWDTFLGWAEYNGYSARETAGMQWRHQGILRRYRAGEEHLFEKLVESALEIAIRCHVSRSYPRKHVVGTFDLSKDNQISVGFFHESREQIRKRKALEREKQKRLETLAGQFLLESINVSERRVIVHAYRKSPFQTGSPSFLAFSPKRKIWFFVSVKSDKGALSPRQYDWIEYIHSKLGKRAMLLRIVPPDTLVS